MGIASDDRGKFAIIKHGAPALPQFPKYLRCYRCLFETKELGCLLGSDICLTPIGSSCITLHIKNSSTTDIMVSDCRGKERMSDCSHTRTSPVFGFWIHSRCCFLDFCNDPKNRAIYTP
ncbi:lymphocyte antigen 6 complex locus protein G5c [Rhynchocyon petersi]